jgi:hypothetical protein
MPYTPQATANPMKTAPRVLSMVGKVEDMVFPREKRGKLQNWVSTDLGSINILGELLNLEYGKEQAGVRVMTLAGDNRRTWDMREIWEIPKEIDPSKRCCIGLNSSSV